MADRSPPISGHSTWASYVLVSLTVAVGVGSLVLFGVFLFAGSLHLLEVGLDPGWGLVLDACLCLVFFLQHSGMIRKPTRRWMLRFVSERYLGALFTLVSAVALLALVVLWQESTWLLASADGLYRWSLRVVFFAALAANLWGTWSLRLADIFGTEPLLRRTAETSPPAPMVVRGPYRWVRHPLYLTTLLLIWSHPDLTADRLLFNGLFTFWIIAGTVLEERDLVAVYGDSYRDYQRSVPMLIPYRKPGGRSGAATNAGRSAKDGV